MEKRSFSVICDLWSFISCAVSAWFVVLSSFIRPTMNQDKQITFHSTSNPGVDFNRFGNEILETTQSTLKAVRWVFTVQIFTEDDLYLLVRLSQPVVIFRWLHSTAGSVFVALECLHRIIYTGGGTRFIDWPTWPTYLCLSRVSVFFPHHL